MTLDWVVSLTCDQVRQRPHGALQMCSGIGVPPHILGVALIVSAQLVYVLLNVRHYSFDLLHKGEKISTKKYTLHLAATFVI